MEDDFYDEGGKIYEALEWKIEINGSLVLNSTILLICEKTNNQNGH